MHALRHAARLAAVLVVAGCQSTQAPATTTTTPSSTGPAAQPSPATTPSAQVPTAASPATAPGAGTGAGARRRPDPRQQEAGRANVVRQLLAQIAGRENEPAGTVFKNVQLLKDVPAGQFLQLMNAQYGRSLGMSCGGCHVPGQWDKDERANKAVARGMQQMVNRLNAEVLPRIPQIDEDYTKVSCGTCHRGTNSPPNILPHPDSVAAPATAPSTPPPAR